MVQFLRQKSTPVRNHYVCIIKQAYRETELPAKLETEEQNRQPTAVRGHEMGHNFNLRCRVGLTRSRFT